MGDQLLYAIAKTSQMGSIETVPVQTQPLMEVVPSETETDGANIMQPTSYDELREKLKDKEWRVQITLGTYRPTT